MSHVTNGPPTARKFWVVGGKYDSMAFDRLLEGTISAFGPFASEDEAKSAWQSVTEATRSHATIRFTIAAEPALTMPGW
jgi:hypothetical protein